MALKTYMLLFEVKTEIKLNVGRLGSVTLWPATYIYVGSGGKNIFKRVERHFRQNKKEFWHIDYLTSKIKPSLALLLSMDEREVAKVFSHKFPYISGFGSTDDPEAPSHLFYFEAPLSAVLRKILDILT